MPPTNLAVWEPLRKATHWAKHQRRIWQTRAHHPNRRQPHPGSRMVRRRERFRNHGNRRPSMPSCPASGASRASGVMANGAVRDSKTARGSGRQRTRRTSTHQSSQWQTVWRTRRVVVDFQLRLLREDCSCRCSTFFKRLGLRLFISGPFRGGLFGWSCFTTKRDFGYL